MNNTKKDVKTCMHEVILGCKIDLKKAEEYHIILMKNGTLSKDMPEIETNFLLQNKCGSSYHFNFALFKLLRAQGYECFIAMPVLKNLNDMLIGNHVYVCYYIDTNDGTRGYIADIEAAIKTNDIDKYYKIPILEFLDKNLGKDDILNFYDPLRGNVPFFTLEFFGKPISARKRAENKADVKKMHMEREKEKEKERKKEN